jgi:hypothetical protein
VEAREEASVWRLPLSNALLPIKWLRGSKKIQGEPHKWQKARISGKKQRMDAWDCFPSVLLSHPTRHHIELRPGPEKRPAHANCTAIGDASGTVVSLRLLENSDCRLP